MTDFKVGDKVRILLLMNSDKIFTKCKVGDIGIIDSIRNDGRGMFTLNVDGTLFLAYYNQIELLNNDIINNLKGEC